MKPIIFYAIPFVLAFILVTAAIMYLNSTYQNIFWFDFSPKSSTELLSDSTKAAATDSLKTLLSDNNLSQNDSLHTDSLLAHNSLDTLNTETTAINKISDNTSIIQKEVSDKNTKKNQDLALNTKSPKLDSIKTGTSTINSNSSKTLKDTAYVSWLKNVTSIYEAMEPKKAAKIIQNYSDNVARDILYSMKKKTAAKIVAELNPEIANRIFRFE
ncbi:MAG: hypothetical protein HXY50_13110 [Ignavibacteriaceae bacterium]|nr:hypothetical protein [Ignavibacteriaceae bacterium]